MEEIKKYFRKTPVVNGYLKVNDTINSKTHTFVYVSKEDIKGFKVTECSGEEYDNAYTIEVIFDYELFGYSIEDSVPEPSNILEFKTTKEAEEAIEFLLKELKK